MQPYVAVSSRRGDADGARTELLMVQVKQKKNSRRRLYKIQNAPMHTQVPAKHRTIIVFLGFCFTRFSSFTTSHTINSSERRKSHAFFCIHRRRIGSALAHSNNDMQPIGGIMTSSSASSGGMARCVYRCRNWTPSSSMRCFLSNVGEAKKVKTRCKIKHASAMSPRPRFLCNNLNNVLCLLFASFRSGRTICEPSLCVCFSFS